jgi:hypothetical protein
MIGRLLENAPAFAERVWTEEPKTDFDTYCKLYKKICQKAAELIADK